LRQYGVLLDDASLRQAALELGIISTTKNALTPQQKVLAAQALIYKQTGTAQGDFERTSDGLANKTRILTAQLENAKTTIGTALLPIVLELATLFSNKVIPIVQKVADAFSSKPEGVGGTLNNLANSIKTFVQPIFEGLRSAFNKIKATVIENKDEFQAFFDVVKAAAPIIGKVIGAAFNVAGTVASTVLNLISNVLGALKTIINTAIDGINLVIRGLNLIKPGPDIASIGKIGSSTGSSSTGGISVPRASLPSGFKPAATVTTKPTVTVTPTITPTPIATVAASAAAAAKAAAANTAVSSNFNPGRFRMGEEADRVGTTINLTVNGAIDSEGTARTIVDTLNNSFYRGTGGATNLQIA
jgi:hypothetical protein